MAFSIGAETTMMSATGPPVPMVNGCVYAPLEHTGTTGGGMLQAGMGCGQGGE